MSLPCRSRPCRPLLDEKARRSSVARRRSQREGRRYVRDGAKPPRSHDGATTSFGRGPDGSTRATSGEGRTRLRSSSRRSGAARNKKKDDAKKHGEQGEPAVLLRSVSL